MHRPRLILLFAAAVTIGGCKSREPAPASAQTSALAPKRAAVDPLEVPEDTLFAASAHIRIVDVAAGQVVAGINLQKAITAIEFTPDGERAFVAASDGVREIDVDARRVIAQLTMHPARALIRSLDGKNLYILEHQVIADKNGAREVLPFHLLTVDLKTRGIVKDQELGQRIAAVIPAEGERGALIVDEGGGIRLGDKTIDPAAGLASNGPVQPRPDVVRSHDGRTAFLPVQGTPSRILAIDLWRGTTRALDLGRPLLIRGLALTPDGTKLVVNAMKQLIVLDAVNGRIHAEVELEDAHGGIAMAPDGRRVYLAQTVDGTGGAVSVVRLDPLKVLGKIHLDDISPWVIAVRPHAAYALR
jgi:hypothetical protein